MKRKINLRFISITTFVSEVVLFWIIWFIDGYAWVHGVDVVSDVLGLVLDIGRILIIVSAFLTIIQLLRNYATDSSMSAFKKLGAVMVLLAFICIHIVKIECAKDIYEDLIIDEDVLYTFAYRWLAYNDDKGVLEGIIDTKDIIDNRR